MTSLTMLTMCQHFNVFQNDMQKHHNKMPEI